MSATKPLLCIAVPTWNRCNFLRGFLDSVGLQSGGIDPRMVEFVVCDDASVDATSDVVAAFQSTCRLPVRYFRNESNTGLTGNLILAIQRSTGRFTMIYGDDDLLPPERLRQILSLLESHQDYPSVLFQLQEASPPIPDVTTPTAVTILGAAGSYFYDFGNCGRFALRTDLAQAAVAQLSELATVTWPQTAVGFLAMTLAPTKTPLLLAPFPSVSSPHHSANTVYTMSYLWCVAFRDLFGCALMLRSRIGSPAFRAASSHVFSWPRTIMLARSLMHSSLIEPPEVRRTVRRSVVHVLRHLPLGAKSRLAAPLLSLLLPRWLLFVVLWFSRARRRLFKQEKAKPLRQIVADSRSRLDHAKTARPGEPRFSVEEACLWRNGIENSQQW